MSKKKTIAVCAYHPRDLIFFHKLFSKQFYKFKFVLIVLFDEKIKLQKVKNIIILNFYDFIVSNKFIKNISKYKISENKMMHEKILFNSSAQELRNKYSLYLNKFVEIFSLFKIDIIFQELGGLVTHFASFDAAKLLKKKHIFIEPSVKASHCFFLLNSSNVADALTFNKKKEAEESSKKYKNSVLQLKVKVHNQKDFHYDQRSAIGIFLNFYYYKTLLRKFLNNLKNNRSEYPTLFFHLKIIFIKLKNNFKNYFYFKKNKNIDFNSKDIIYFPLHSPNDYALTIRAPKMLNQTKVISNLLKNCQNYKIITKEHPLNGNYYAYKNISKDNSKILFKPHYLSSLEIIKKAKVIITINSKTGIEGLILNIPVISLSRNYYCAPGLSKFVTNFSDIKNKLQKLNLIKPKEKKVDNFLISLFKKIAYFDLYNNNRYSIQMSRKTIIKLVNFI